MHFMLCTCYYIAGAFRNTDSMQIVTHLRRSAAIITNGHKMNKFQTTLIYFLRNVSCLIIKDFGIHSSIYLIFKMMSPAYLKIYAIS